MPFWLWISERSPVDYNWQHARSRIMGEERDASSDEKIWNFQRARLDVYVQQTLKRRNRRRIPSDLRKVRPLPALRARHALCRQLLRCECRHLGRWMECMTSFLGFLQRSVWNFDKLDAIDVKGKKTTLKTEFPRHPVKKFWNVNRHSHVFGIF